MYVCRGQIPHSGTKKALKGHCHGLTCAEFKSAKTHFTAMETYKYWSSFDKNYNAIVMKLKKCSIIVIPPGAQDPTRKRQPDFFKFCHCDSVPLLMPWVMPGRGGGVETSI